MVRLAGKLAPTSRLVSQRFRRTEGPIGWHTEERNRDPLRIAVCTKSYPKDAPEIPPPPPTLQALHGEGEGQAEQQGWELVGAMAISLLALAVLSEPLHAAIHCSQVSATRGISCNDWLSLPSTVLPGGVPIGLQDNWQHKWRYDANGQPWLQLRGRWWLLHRASGTKARVLVQAMDPDGRARTIYEFLPPTSWPLEEIDLTDQRTMAMLFGTNAELEGDLRLVK